MVSPALRRVCLAALAAALAAGALPAADAPPAPTPAPTPGSPPPPSSISTTLLPEDPARALVIRTCVVCHPAELLASKKRTADTWGTIITKMVDYGARASEDQQDQIYAYLTTYLLGTDTSTGAAAPARPATTPASPR